MKVTKCELIYFIAFIIHYVVNMLFTTTVKNFLGIIPLDVLSQISIVVVFIFLGYSLILSLNKKYLLISCIALVCTFIVFLNTKSNILIISVLFIVSAKNINIDKLVKIVFWVNSLFIIVVALCAFADIIPLYEVAREDHMRYALGFVSYNTFAIAVFRSVLLWVLMRYKAMRTWHCFIVLLIGYLTYCLADSRIAFYTSLIYFVLLVYSKWNKKSFTSKLFIVVVELIAPILAFISIYFGSIYMTAHDHLIELNELFSGRLYFINSYLTTYGIKMWGQRIAFTTVRDSVSSGATWFNLDNSYAYSLICFGIIISALLLLIYSIIIYKAFKNDDKKVLLYAIAMLIVGLTENGIFYVSFNFVLLYFIKMLEFDVKIYRRVSK